MRKASFDIFDRGQDLENFNFRNLHPKILLGTASDRYSFFHAESCKSVPPVKLAVLIYGKKDS